MKEFSKSLAVTFTSRMILFRKWCWLKMMKQHSTNLKPQTELLLWYYAQPAPVDRFWLFERHTTCFAQGYFYWMSHGYCPIPISGFKCPKTHILGAWIGVKPNAQNIRTFVLSKLLKQFKPKFAQWQDHQVDYSWLVIPKYAPQIQDNGWPLSWQKSLYFRNCLTDFDDLQGVPIKTIP